MMGCSFKMISIYFLDLVGYRLFGTHLSNDIYLSLFIIYNKPWVYWLKILIRMGLSETKLGILDQYDINTE
jgi:hypothetical protein